MADVVKNATIRNVAFWACLFFSIGLITAGFFTPPRGAIDGSVLSAVGELFGFATLYVVYHAIEKGVDIKLQHGSTSVTAGDLNDMSENKAHEDVE